MALAAVLASACADDGKSSACLANIDCAAGSACVEGECTSDQASCHTVGAFAEIAATYPQNGQQIHEIHVTVDRGGGVHYCYFGDEGAYYGRQLPSSQSESSTGEEDAGLAAHFEFVEEELTVNDAPARCGAIAVDRSGSVFVLSRSPSAVMTRASTGGWAAVNLHGLEGVEAQGALTGDRTLISLTPDEAGGVYVAMSLGYQLEAQPAYVGRLSGGAYETLANGWSETGAHTIIGHGPQVVVGAETRVVMGRVFDFDVVLADTSLNVDSSIEGVYPRAVSGPGGVVAALYLDRNFNLLLDRITADGFEPFADLGEVAIDEFAEGQLPWDMALDTMGTAHLLVEDVAQGPDSLVYQQVGSAGDVNPKVVVSSELDPTLPGMQRYALSTDICGRATLALVENDSFVRVIEGR